MEHSNLLHPGTALGHSFRVTEEIYLLLRPVRVSSRAIMREVTTSVRHAPTSRFPVVDSSRRPTENINHLPQHHDAVRHKAPAAHNAAKAPPAIWPHKILKLFDSDLNVGRKTAVHSIVSDPLHSRCIPQRKAKVRLNRIELRVVHIARARLRRRIGVRHTLAQLDGQLVLQNIVIP